MRLRAWFRTLDPDWRAAVVGAMAAPVLTLVGLLVGAVAGGLLPWDCQGLACVFLSLVLLYSAGILTAWAIITAVAALTRRWWPSSRLRIRVLQVLAAASYAPTVWLVVTIVGEAR